MAQRITRRRLWLCVGVATPIAIAVVAIVVLWLWPGALRGTIERRLEAALGGEVAIGDMAWGDGTLQLDDVTLRAPGLTGEAADILTIERMRVGVAMGAAFTSDSMLQSIQIERARVLVAGELDASSPTLNLSALTPARDDGPAASASSSTASSPPPTVDIDRLELVVGLYQGAQFTRTGSAVFEVRLKGDAQGHLRGTLTELEVEEPMVLQASGDPSTASVALEATALRLDARTRGLMPFPDVQSALKTLDLEGAVPLFELTLERARPVEALLVLDDMSLRLDPDWFELPDGDAFWVAYRNGVLEPARTAPLMRIDGGRIAFENDQLTVSTLRGDLIGPEGETTAVPWAVDLEIHELLETLSGVPKVEQALDKASFVLRLSADSFRVEHGVPVVLPRRAARILELFGVQSGTAGIRLVASHVGGDQPVDVSGVVSILNARGAYERFPYPLTSLDASIDFDLDRVQVRSLRAAGRSGSMLSIEGQVETSGGDDINLDIQATNVPIDGVFLSAMPDVAADALRDVLPPEGELPDEGAAFGAASLRGDVRDRVDLNLHVSRQDGGDVDISGRIDFKRLEVEWRAFPWPVLLDRGWFDWTEGVLTLRSEEGEGVSLRTPDGVVGSISVRIDLPSLEADVESSPFEARVALQVENQPVTGALRDAVRELSPDGGAVLQRTGLTGLLDLEADVHLTTAVPSTFRVLVALRNGLGDARGLDLVGDVTLADLLDARDCSVDGRIEVTRDAVDLLDLTLAAGERSIVLGGSASGEGETHIKGTSLHAGPWVALLVPEPQLMQAIEIAHRWRPHGRFDLDGRYSAERGLHGTVTGTSISLQGLHPPVRLAQTAGTVELAGAGATFDDLKIGMTADGNTLGILLIDGGRRDGVGSLRIEGFDIDLGTPLVADLVPALGDAAIGDVWAALDPAGEIDLEVQTTPDSWRVEVLPKVIALTREGARFSAAVESGVLDLSDAGMTIDNLDLRAGDGARAMFDGEAAWDDASLTGRFEFTGSLRSDLAAAMASTQVQSVLGAIAFMDGGRSRLRQGRLELQHLDTEPVGTIEADISVESAHLEVGVELDQLNARARLEVALLAGQSPAIDLELLEADAMFGHLRLERVRGELVSDESGAMHLRDLHGDLGGGRLVVEGTVDSDTDHWFVQVAVAGARLESLAQQGEGEGHVATGRIDTSIRLGGRIDTPSRRRGSGHFRIVEGDLGPLPVAVGLQQLLQLSSPLVGAIDYAEVKYHIDGDTVTLDDILLETTSGGISAFSMHGHGTLDWETLEVDLRLRPRGGWLVIGDLIGLMQDQLYEVSVEGSLVDPEVGIVALPGLSRNE